MVSTWVKNTLYGATLALGLGITGYFIVNDSGEPTLESKAYISIDYGTDVNNNGTLDKRVSVVKDSETTHYLLDNFVDPNSQLRKQVRGVQIYDEIADETDKSEFNEAYNKVSYSDLVNLALRLKEEDPNKYVEFTKSPFSDLRNGVKLMEKVNGGERELMRLLIDEDKKYTQLVGMALPDGRGGYLKVQLREGEELPFGGDSEVAYNAVLVGVQKMAKRQDEDLSRRTTSIVTGDPRSSVVTGYEPRDKDNNLIRVRDLQDYIDTVQAELDR
jgi:hypothetical protein